MTNFANGAWLRLSLCVSCTAIAAMFVSGKLFAQAVDRPDLSIELVDPKVLRVCADPNNMPFSTERGEGFENRLAELLADKLGRGFHIAGIRRQQASCAIRSRRTNATSS